MNPSPEPGVPRPPPEPLQNHPPQPENRNECFYTDKPPATPTDPRHSGWLLPIVLWGRKRLVMDRAGAGADMIENVLAKDINGLDQG